MEVEKQVCTFEQAKRLKELGITQQVSLFNWGVITPDPLGERHYYAVSFTNRDFFTGEAQGEYLYDAFTVVELGMAISVLVTSPAFDGVIDKLSREREAGHDRETLNSETYIWQTILDPEFLAELLIRLLDEVPRRMIDEVNKALTK